MRCAGKGGARALREGDVVGFIEGKVTLDTSQVGDHDSGHLDGVGGRRAGLPVIKLGISQACFTRCVVFLIQVLSPCIVVPNPGTSPL